MNYGRHCKGRAKSMKCKKESTAQKAYLRRQLHRRRLVLFCRIFLFVFFLICWEMSARLGLIDAFIFSSPSRTVRCFLRMMQDKSILIHTGVTLYETLISFTLVILCGLIGAVLLWSSRNLSEILEPYLVMLNSRQNPPSPRFSSSGLGATSARSSLPPSRLLSSARS